MSKAGRTYVVVDISGMSESALQSDFNSVKNFGGVGVIETSLSTCRKSLDGTQMILKYRNPGLGNAIANRFKIPIQFSGTHTQMLTYLSANASEWELTDEIS